MEIKRVIVTRVWMDKTCAGAASIVKTSKWNLIQKRERDKCTFIFIFSGSECV